MLPVRFFFILFALLIAPYYAHAQQQGPPAKYFNERFVIKAMAGLSGAQATYQATSGNGNYGSLGELYAAGLIDSAIATGRKYGYIFEIATASNTYVISATPVAYRKTGLRSYYIDQRGVLFGENLFGLPANPANAHYIDTCALFGINDNERCTIAAMRTLHAAQMTYAATVGGGQYADLFATLHNAGLIDMILATAGKHGYNFEMLVLSGPPWSFQIWAVPHSYGTSGVRSFYVDATGVVRGRDRSGGNADQNDPPVNRQVKVR